MLKSSRVCEAHIPEIDASLRLSGFSAFCRLGVDARFTFKELLKTERGPLCFADVGREREHQAGRVRTRYDGRVDDHELEQRVLAAEDKGSSVPETESHASVDAGSRQSKHEGRFQVGLEALFRGRGQSSLVRGKDVRLSGE